MRETTETAAPRRTASPRRRRWLRRLAAGVAGLLVVAVALYGWAWSSVDRSTVARALVWADADVGDQSRFPARPIPAPRRAGPLPAGGEIQLGAAAGGGASFDDSLRAADTLAFLVVHDDRLVYERYFGGADRRTRQTSFSVAKSFVSTLVGIAIDEGLIGSVTDPVTRYLPELAARDPRFARITLRDLLTMSSGIRYWETDLPWPWADDTFTYYGVNLREIALNRTEIERPPGQVWHYNNYHPLLLGMVLERATGMPVSGYMASRLWQPLGAEGDASWNLDSERSGFEKMESGLNATPVDFARFGLLALHQGTWNGHRIVSTEWIRAATAADTSTDPAKHYQYFWWVDTERPGRFYALGNYGQYVYVAPDADAVVVRFGRDWGHDNRTWLATFRDVADRLARRS
jgi:CubicO group peptidase (beta-lactamase class C family)